VSADIYLKYARKKHKNISRSTSEKNSCTKHCFPVCVMAKKNKQKRGEYLLHFTVATVTVGLYGNVCTSL
jgi:hypothetical protein